MLSAQPVVLVPGPGVIERHAAVETAGLPPRNVDVWLPPGYEDSVPLRYPVIYMHDGRNLFMPEETPSGKTWAVHEAVVALMKAGHIAGAIIVGVWHGPERWREYAPQSWYEAGLASEVHAHYGTRADGPPYSDRYLSFLVDALKPAIDSRYRTLPAQSTTSLMGSSMGGLISLHAISRYPNVFGGAACLSTHWTAGREGLVDHMGARLPAPADHRLYFDFGTETVDADYAPYQQRMDGWLAAAGYVPGANWITRKFEGAEHHERSWRARVHIPLQFLLAPARGS